MSLCGNVCAVLVINMNCHLFSVSDHVHVHDHVKNMEVDHPPYIVEILESACIQCDDLVSQKNQVCGNCTVVGWKQFAQW